MDGCDETLNSFDAAQEEAKPPRSFAELMEAAQALKPDQADELAALLAEISELQPIRREAVLKAIKKATGITLGALREQIAEDSGGADILDHLDLARSAISKIGAENILSADSFVWQWQDRGVWEQQKDRAVKKAVQDSLDKTFAVDVTAVLVASVTDVLKSETYRPRLRFNLGNPETINCLNGELVLGKTGWQLEPHCRENYRTTQIPVAYDPDAKAPRFKKFIKEIFGQDADRNDKVKCLMQLIGYTMMSHTRHEMFVMLLGEGANGKSVLLAVLEGLVGRENIAGVQPSNFDHEFQRAYLHEKLANIVTELKQGEVIADAELKAITSGEPATVSHKFKDPFTMHPFATCWFGTNHMPHTRDFSPALFRRARILKFNRVFTEEEQDPKLKDALQAELPGILNLALKAYAKALDNGFTEPVSSTEAKKEWRLEADQVAQFVEDCCRKRPDGKETITDVYLRYTTWAADNGIRQLMSKRGLSDRLTLLRFGHKRDGAKRYVIGLELTPL